MRRRSVSDGELFRYLCCFRIESVFYKMLQHLIIVLLFLAALGYLGYIVYKSFTSSGCTSGCGSCGIDFNKLRKEMEKKRLNQPR